MELENGVSENVKCSVVININGKNFTRNGIIKTSIQHEKDAWCVELIPHHIGEPFYVKVHSNEIFEPVDFYTNLVNALDELAN